MALLRISAFRRFSIRALSIALVAIAGLCSAQELPKGWTIPAVKLTRQAFRQKDTNRFLAATGDFNGDGMQDKALILLNKGTSKLGLFICLTTAKGCDWHRLAEMDSAFLDVMEIGTVKSGKYETACGKGYWQCGKDEPETLVTKRDAIEFFKDESASSVYVYNPRKHAFTSIATSD